MSDGTDAKSEALRAHRALHLLEGLQAALAMFLDLDQVIAEIGFDDAAHLADVEIERRILELRYHHATAEAAEVAALRRRRAIGMLTRCVSEFGAALDLERRLLGLRLLVVPVFRHLFRDFKGIEYVFIDDTTFNGIF